MSFSLKNLSIGLTVALLLSSGVSPLLANANEVDESNDTIEQELSDTQTDNSIVERKYILDGGQEIITDAVSINGIQISYTDGGLNLVGENVSAMQRIRNTLQNTDNTITVFAYLIGWGVTPLRGIITGELISNLRPNFTAAINSLTTTMNLGWTAGGVRITTTGVSPIYGTGTL